jgi:hypothetical protein
MLRLFISYSHKDRDWCDRLHAHLVGISKEVVSSIWFDERISPGDEWSPDIVTNLDQADIVLFLVSSNFVESEFCQMEVARALELKARSKCTIIPVILRHYNLTGSGYSHLQFSPHGASPIDSDAWPDKDLAFKTVSEEVEATARKLLGGAPKQRALPVNPAELQQLLHHLCDRTPQHDALFKSLQPSKRKEQRPFVIVVFGHQDESLERFIGRLKHVLLKKYLSEGVGFLSPLPWPEYARGATPMDLFGSSLPDSVGASPYASVAEMNAALATQNVVNLLPTSVPANIWDRKSEALFAAYFELWSTWPKLPAERFLIPILSIEYTDKLPAHPKLVRYLEKLNFDVMQNVGGVYLPELSAVKHDEFKNWLRLEQVRPKMPAPEDAVDKSNQISSLFPARMLHLADKHLPRFLDQL